MKIGELQVKASVTIDKRRQKADGTYPVKMYVWDSSLKKGKFYGTKLSVSEKDFCSAWETVRPRKEFLNLRQQLQSLEVHTQAEIDRLEHFSFELFERKAGVPKGEASNVFFHLERRARELHSEGRIKYAKSYGSTSSALRNYAKSSRLSFSEVTPTFLQGLEDQIIQKGQSPNTVGIYMRNLRAVFNSAIESKDAAQEQYPFGRKKYVIPSKSTTKKALTVEQLRKLLDATLQTDGHEWARSMFLFSYASNGMNMKDIALLRWERVFDDRLEFVREKTKRTKKDKIKSVTVFINDYHRSVLKRYGGSPEKSPYVFPVLNESMDAEQQYKAVDAFSKSVKQHLQKICAAHELPVFSPKWARHSFATVSVRKGASMELMMESLGHSDMKTTLNYFAGFDDKTKKELSETVMDF